MQPLYFIVVVSRKKKIKTMKIYKSLLLLIALISLFACDKNDVLFDNNRRVTGHGEIQSETVYVNDFSSVDLQNVSNVYIKTGMEQKVTLTAYENILSYMEADVLGDELVLRFNRDINVNSNKEIRVDITVPELEKVTLSGVGNFYLEGPMQESLGIELNGVGNVEAYGLPVYYADINLDGTGKVEVKVKETLKVDIDGLGNVYYQGDPEIIADINGLGEVVKD
jgi:hypothetical protein